MTENNITLATFGGGCFWCLETIFLRLEGVSSVVSGYSGGVRENPSYEQVCSGSTGHAEVIQITFSPEIISFSQLLEVFWSVHDPTTLNRQGGDVGTQYRSVIFCHDKYQRETAEEVKSELNRQMAFPDPVVTEISDFVKFYPAERYHQDYYSNNGSQPYCSVVIRPKLEKFAKVFSGKLKKEFSG